MLLAMRWYMARSLHLELAMVLLATMAGAGFSADITVTWREGAATGAAPAIGLRAWCRTTLPRIAISLSLPVAR